VEDAATGIAQRGFPRFLSWSLAAHVIESPGAAEQVRPPTMSASSTRWS